MGKKNRAKQKLDYTEKADFQVNPFASLSLPTVDKTPPPPQPAKIPEQKPEKLNAEDKQLLKEFGDASVSFQSGRPKPKLHMRLEKKGRGGKTVTIIEPFKDWDPIEQMELLQDIKRELGIGGRFQDDRMELQGDQRQRIGDWFNKRGFRIAGQS